jgi:sporulation protein YlmC with PRC-barrel domain
MQRNIKSLVDFTLGASDGVIGKVKEFYFDDETWVLRYLIVDTGNWLTGRIVLISPEDLLTLNWENKVFTVDLSKEQIKNSPDINTVFPVSRQEEIKLNQHYPLAHYWSVSGHYLSSAPVPIVIALPEMELEERKQTSLKDKDKHLRSTETITGYKIKATDGEIGDVEDFFIDINTWKIDFILIDTGDWFPGKKVLISPDKIKEIDWETGAVIIDTTIAHIKSSPEYDPKRELNGAYTLILEEHYNSVVS